MDKNENIFVNKAADSNPDLPTEDSRENVEEEPCKGYGWRNFRPKCLQFLNSPKWFLVVIVIYAVCQGIAVIGLPSLVLPSIEKRFSFSSKELGIIAASNDVSALALVVFISFYGDYANKVKWMGCGATMAGIGVLLFALPHLIVGKYEPFGRRDSSLCRISNFTINQGPSDCKTLSGGEWYYTAAFVGAQLITGAGVSPFYSLLPAYLDEIVDPRSLSIYLGIWYFFNFAGPGIGYLIGGKLLSIYVDIKQPVGQNLTPRNPAWIGAWWLGFVIFGLAILLCSTILIGFPSEMPGAKERRQQHIREGHLKLAENARKPVLRNLLPELRNLLSNWTFLFCTLATTSMLLYNAPLFVFFSKILREKFGLDPVRTGYAMATLSLAGLLLGNTFGSFIVRLFSLKETCKKAAMMCFVVYFLTAASPMVFLIPGCVNTNLAGVTQSHNSSVVNQMLTHPGHNSPLRSYCNTNCGCSLKKFSPVCGSDSVTYFDACHAGCKKVLPNKTFINCSCIPSSYSNSGSGTAKPGYCDRNCKNTIIFLGLCLIVLIIRFSSAVPGRIVTLRCVPDDKRAFAIGIQYLLIKVIGLLPSPIIFGHLVDLSCRLWQDTCGTKGRCFDYDLGALSRNICIYGACVSFISAVFYFFAWYFCKPEHGADIVQPVVQVMENYGADPPEETKF